MAWAFRVVAYARVPILPIERVLKIVTLKNFDGCTSCMPSSLKEYISPWPAQVQISLYQPQDSRIQTQKWVDVAIDAASG